MPGNADASPARSVRAAVWKRVVAATLDFFTVFYLGGLAIGHISGAATGASFQLSGLPALILFALIAVYFYVCRRHLGGTLWDRIFKIARPQPP